MIEVEHVHKNFGSVPALRDVTFTVEPGTITGLLGPNGSGKTTLLRILAGFFPPTAGRVRIAGYDATARPLALRRRVGYLPEQLVLYPEMRVHRFLELCADLRGLARGRKRQAIDAVLQACGLRRAAARRMGTLSKGYRQRVGLAQALLHQPEVLILDEPTAGLDPGQIVELRGLIRALRGRQTVLLSTHVLSEVEITCDRVIIIDRGQVLAAETTQALLGRLGNAAGILVRVQGPPEAIAGSLSCLPGVDHVQPTGWTGGSENGGCEFRVFSQTGAATPQAVAAAVVAHGWGLLEIRATSPGLEDCFVRLTRESPSVAH